MLRGRKPSSGKLVHKEFNRKPLFNQTETLSLGEAGKYWRSVLTNSSTRNRTRELIDPSRVRFHWHKICKHPDTENFTLFIIASNSLSTRRSRRGESLCSNSSVSPCWSCDTKMLSPLPPPSLCLTDDSKQQLLNVSANTDVLSVNGKRQSGRDFFYLANDWKRPL